MQAPAQEEPAFLERRGGRLLCNGQILEMDHQALFYGRVQKLLNTILRGEPYQFSHQSLEYTLRVRPITGDLTANPVDFCYYGNCLGRLQIGDEVQIQARDNNDRRVVRSLYNRTTNSMVRPGLQVSARVLRLLVVLLILVLAALGWGICYLFRSGILAAFLISLVLAWMPVLIVLFGIWLLFRSVFPERRRR